MTFLLTLRKALCPDALVYVDVTQTEHWAAEAFPVRAPRTYFNPTDNQAMGWSVPAAIGGQRAFLTAVPGDRRGLAFGLYGTGLMGGQGIGPVLAGVTADILGAGMTMAVLGMAILAAAARYGPLPPDPEQ